MIVQNLSAFLFSYKILLKLWHHFTKNTKVMAKTRFDMVPGNKSYLYESFNP